MELLDTPTIIVAAGKGRAMEINTNAARNLVAVDVSPRHLNPDAI